MGKCTGALALGAPGTTPVASVPMIDITTGTDRIVICAEIDAPRDRVWRALTEEERIAEWWGSYVSLDAPRRAPDRALDRCWRQGGGHLRGGGPADRASDAGAHVGRRRLGRADARALPTGGGREYYARYAEALGLGGVPFVITRGADPRTRLGMGPAHGEPGGVRGTDAMLGSPGRVLVGSRGACGDFIHALSRQHSFGL